MELEIAEKDMRDLQLAVREEKRQIGLRKTEVLQEKWMEGKIATLQIEVGEHRHTRILANVHITFDVYLHIIVALISIRISFCSERTNSIKEGKHLDEIWLYSHRKRLQGNKNTQCSFSASGSRDWACVRAESQRLVLTLCWTRHLAAQPLSVLDERRAGTTIATCLEKNKPKKHPFSFPPSVNSLCCHVVFFL